MGGRLMRHVVGACVAAVLTAVAGFMLVHASLAYAHDVPDLSRTATVAVTLRDGGTPVGGGSLAMYRVGENVEDDGNYGFEPVYVLKGAGFSYVDVTSPQLAADLAAYLAAEGSVGLVRASSAVDASGTARFEGLELGLWLVVQTQAGSGYEPVTPFLVSVPTYDKATGRYVYEVDASPKVALERTPTPPTQPDYPPKIPQTGQLNWPIPVLGLGGLALVAVGVLLRRGRDD